MGKITLTMGKMMKMIKKTTQMILIKYKRIVWIRVLLGFIRVYFS